MRRSLCKCTKCRRVLRPGDSQYRRCILKDVLRVRPPMSRVLWYVDYKP